MSMKASTRQVDGVTIIDISGRVTLGEGTSATLRDQMRQLIAKGNKRILLNLADVSFIDSAGIGELVRALTSIRNEGGDLKLLNVPKRIRDLLQITKLHSVFDMKEDETAAVSAFSKP
jgi:anti-sigma B factor antagonist